MINDDLIYSIGKKKLFTHKLLIPSQNLYQVMDSGNIEQIRWLQAPRNLTRHFVT